MPTDKNAKAIDNSRLWDTVLETIKVDVTEPVYNTWFNQTRLVSLKKEGKRYTAQIGCPSTYVKNTIESRYFGLLQDTINKSLDAPSDLVFVIKTPKGEKKQENPLDTPLFSTQTKNAREFAEIVSRSGLRTTFKFENYAVSSSNQMAWAAADAVSKNLATAYNPLFIYGGVGVGKTHLMNAVGLCVLEKDAEAKVICCTGEQFTNDIVEGIRNKSTPAIRKKYRKLKALLIDDIQFIAGKNAVQEEFFHTFNALVNTGSQVILTSDRPPSEIAKLEERLRSRFEAGLIVDISPPDFELRCAIVQIKSKEKGLNLPMDIIQLIAGNIESARKIEGFLVSLISQASIKNADIDKEFVESALTNRVGEETNSVQTKRVEPKDMITAVAKYYSIGKRALLGKSRARPFSRPRQVLMYLMKMQLDLPYQEIGRLIGGRDHSTVIHAVDKITKLASSDVQTRGDIRGIKQML